MSNSIKRESPLQYFHGWFNKSSAPESLFNDQIDCDLVIKEAPLSAHLNLRGDAEDSEFCAAVTAVLDVPVPKVPGTYHRNGNTSIYWLGPSEWLILEVGGDGAVIEATLRASLKGHISVVDVSGGQTCINLRGAGAATVLKKSSVYDFEGWSDAQSAYGRVVQTTFAKASAAVSNRPDGSYDLVIRRSFADYLAQWLLDAGGEFGCRIESS
ncbi:sarcosine oxidase subunit gamma family protein [Porticoccaceae bacterium]|jgi:sarcosine oxidase subunit gamma|nr:sarcosine oxidase subunit gamma family protein [Porticoccaceae bacterium]